MRRFVWRAFFLVGISFFSVFSGVQTVFALGVSPAIVTVRNLANGVEVEKEFKISRANPSKTEFMSVSHYGEGAEYVQLSSDRLELPKGQQSVPFPFTINPVAAPNGVYTVEVAFNTIEPETEGEGAAGSSVSMRVGITGILRFEIIDREVVDFEILDVYARETEVGQPIVLYFSLKNKGNIDIRPDSIKYHIVDRSDSGNTFQGTVQKENFDAVGPSQTETVNFAIREKIPQGEYFLSLDFFYGGEVVFTSEKTELSVYAAGTLAQKAELKNARVNGEIFEPGSLVKFDATVENTGDISIEPVMYVELEKDGQQIDILRSEKKILLTGQETNFTASFKGMEKGEYVGRMYLEYGIYKSEPQEFEFRIGKPGIGMYVGMGIGILLILLLIIFLAKKMKKKDEPEPPVANMQPPQAPQPTQPTASVVPPVAAPTVVPPVATPPASQTTQAAPQPTAPGEGDIPSEFDDGVSSGS